MRPPREQRREQLARGPVAKRRGSTANASRRARPTR